MVKAVRSCGLPVARVTFDGKRVDVVVGQPESASSELNTDLPSKEPASSGLLAEPKSHGTPLFVTSTVAVPAANAHASNEWIMNRALFTQADVTRACRGVMKAGLRV